MSNNPYSVNTPAYGSYQQPLKGGAGGHAMQPLHEKAGWLILLGWVSIVGGVITCLTIVGVIIGWLPIWMGILLKGAGENLKAGFQSGNEGNLHQASQQLSTYFMIIGVLTLIGLVINVLYIGGIALMIFAAITGAAGR
jgi:hypothetical protein